MYAFFAFVAGLVFGAGLIDSAMMNPAKVQAFLDLAGRWDPSLALVMLGANTVAIVGFAIAKRRAQSLLGTPMELPTSRRVDARLIGGSVAFGIGWGLAGFCPGPALVALGTGNTKAVVFVLAMLAGMIGYELIERARAQVQRAPDAT